MADKKISALTAAATPLAGTEVLPIVQSGSTVKVSVANLTAGRNVGMADLTTTGNTILGDAATDTLNVGNGGLVKDASGNVGVGTATPGGPFEVNRALGAFSPTGNSIAILNNPAAAGQSPLDWVINGTLRSRIRTDFTGDVAYVANGGGHSFWIGGDAGIGTNAVQVTSTGNLNALTGNLVMGTAGKGIDFSANTHAAGMTSELLNDYEEGTFVPVLSGGTTTTYTTQMGRYTKIGRQVFFQCEIEINTIGNGSATIVLLGDLPAAAVFSTVSVGFFNAVATSVTSLTGYIGAAGGNSVQFQSLAAAGTNSAPNAIFQNGARVIFSGQYSV